MDVGIILQPTKSASGKEFTATNLPVFLKCGCVLTVGEAEASTNDTGFVFCPVCEFAYTVKSRAKLLTDNNTLKGEHLRAQEKRCAFFEAEIAQQDQILDHWIVTEAIEYAENEDKIPWIPESDPSSVSDDSECELDDFLNFDSTEYALLQSRLRKLKAKRDKLENEKKERLVKGKDIGAPWVTDRTWKFPKDSEEIKGIQDSEARRAERRAERKARYEARKTKKGTKKVVHNVHVLGKNVPRKWRDADPNARPPANFAEKAREKQGWLTEQEQEELDDDEQAALTEKRRQEWASKQSKVPKIFGSVKRQRWAARLYKIARRRHYFGERMAEIAEDSKRKKWQELLDTHEARLVATRAKCDARVAQLETAGRYEDATSLQATFKEAEDIGNQEIEDEMEARRQAEEAARVKAAMEEEARLKAEEKAKAKAEAEARGETYVDPDAEADEGDEEDE